MHDKTVVEMTDDHADAVIDIYRMGIATGHATFETEPPDWARFTATRLPGHRFVAVASLGDKPTAAVASLGDKPTAAVASLGDKPTAAVDRDERVLGWVACSPVSDRCVYAGVVEHSLYVHPDARGLGVGRALLDTLITSTERAGIWTIQSGVFPENTASLALHVACGFRSVGTRERIGKHHGAWRDVVLLERRSPVV